MKTISINDIKLNNKYLRLDDDVDTLKQSIESLGLIHPLTINKDNELLAGGRRYTALKELGISSIPVNIVSNTPLEQELISIEENIIRQKLSSVEFEACLSRAKDIYDELNPEVAQDIEEEIDEKNMEELIEETGKKPFIIDASEKAGISVQAVKNAIKRDINSSSNVKKARIQGDINASKATELSKLDKSTQNELLPHVLDLDSTETRKLVKETIESGIQNAVEEIVNIDPAKKDYAKFSKSFKKMAKEIRTFLEVENSFNGSEKEKAYKEAEALAAVLSEFLEQE